MTIIFYLGRLFRHSFHWLLSHRSRKRTQITKHRMMGVEEESVTATVECVAKTANEEDEIAVVKEEESNEDSVSPEGEIASIREAPVSPSGSGAPVKKEIGWEKPGWATQPMLSPSKKPKESVGNGNGWEKPAWATGTKLRPTDKGKLLTAKGDLQNPITHVEKNPLDNISIEAIVLRDTEMGSVAKSGMCLANPTTFPKKQELMDVNSVADPAMLRSTEKGQAIKLKGDLQNPITHVEKNHLDDINFEANPRSLRPTEKGFCVRLGDNLARYVARVSLEVVVCLSKPEYALMMALPVSHFFFRRLPKQTYYPYRKESHERCQLYGQPNLRSTRY
jgi:hypothetical protein